MSENDKPYDLEPRTELFAQRVRQLARKLPRTITNLEDIKQLARASASVGSNYIEANESLGKKDFLMRIKICRKESKESAFFLRLLYTNDPEQSSERDGLAQEAKDLMNIFGAILRKSE